MHEFCHRCGGELPSGDGAPPFCPHCGAPQIYLLEHDEPAKASSAENTTDVPAPPRPQQVDWKMAIRCAVVVGGVAAILSVVAMRVEVLSPLTWLWTVSGSLTALALYQKRRPLAWMDAAVGARIGAVVGLALITCMGVSMAAAGLVARYGLHSMAAFDAEFTQQLHAQIEHAAAANPQSPEVMRYLNSPEFRAGIMLTGFAILGGILLVLSTVGGAVSGFLRTRRKASA